MSPTYLEHHGILGQKWGVRRYQNLDGSLTPEGRARLDEKSGLYMNSKNKNKNRKKVEEEYINSQANRNYQDNYFGKYKGNKTADELIADLDQEWNDLMPKYAEATLKDLKMQVTDDAKKYLLDKYGYKAPEDTRTNAKDGKASSIFTKEELSSVGKKDEDPELTELMFMDLVEHNRFACSNKEYSEEFKKFRKDPYNYSLPKKSYTDDNIYAVIGKAYENYKHQQTKEEFREFMKKEIPDVSDDIVDAAYKTLTYEEENYRDFM